MEGKKYYLYLGGDGIDKTKEKIETALETGENTFYSLKECFDYICNIYNHPTVKHKLDEINIEDLSLCYHAYDDRIDRDVYMINTKRIGKENYIEKYGTSIFVSFLIEL